jgi:pimeloyl-ACP methyl ester carboxylesterase
VARLAFGYSSGAPADALTLEGALALPGKGDGNLAVTRRALRSDDVRPDLGGLACPTLVVCGARDRVVPPDESFEYARRLHAPVRALAAAGHLLIAERPEELAALVESWLDGVR